METFRNHLNGTDLEIEELRSNPQKLNWKIVTV